MKKEKKKSKGTKEAQISGYFTRDAAKTGLVKPNTSNMDKDSADGANSGHDRSNSEESHSSEPEHTTEAKTSENRKLNINFGLRSMEDRLMKAILGLELEKKVEEIKDDFTSKLISVTKTLNNNCKRLVQLELCP